MFRVRRVPETGDSAGNSRVPETGDSAESRRDFDMIVMLGELNKM